MPNPRVNKGPATRSKSKKSSSSKRSSNDKERHSNRTVREESSKTRDKHQKKVSDPPREDIVSTFLQFKDLFDEEHDSSDTNRESENGDSSSSSSNDDTSEATSRHDNGNEGIPTWAKSLIKSQQKCINRNNSQLAELKKELRGLKRKRGNDEDNDYEWKKKGNKKQYEFNHSVEEHLQDIATSNELLQARMSAEKGLLLIKERNKLLKIADTHGWDTVNQYTSDPLATDEQDDKKLRKAIKEATRAREKSKSEKESKSRRFARARAFSRESAFSPARLGPQPPAGPQRFVVPPSDKRSSTLHCFRCGKVGHLIRDCVTNIDRNAPANVSQK